MLFGSFIIPALLIARAAISLLWFHHDLLAICIGGVGLIVLAKPLTKHFFQLQCLHLTQLLSGSEESECDQDFQAWGILVYVY
jgi:hypothetical protein